ncbi:unnamed protein product [Sphagnum jensenii]|uniref:Uncharacterized protein n=1 Tax=Sphagnum jensenii TaxID=128206 RepID=A0ABP1AXZ9_9BRYO
MSMAEATGEFSHTQVLINHSPLLSRISELSSTIVGQRLGAGNVSAIAVRPVTREDASDTRAKTSSGKNKTKRNLIAPTKAPPTPNLIMHSGSRPGSTSPPGADNQGPSLVDLSLELEAEFPEELVLEMQSNAAKKMR